MSRVERYASLYEENRKEQAEERTKVQTAEQNIEPGVGDNNARAGKVDGEKALAGKGDGKGAGKVIGKGDSNLTWQGKLLLGVGTAILGITLILCIFLMMPKFLGIKTYLVASGSMEPTIPVGSMIYCKEVNPVNLNEDDIIVFFKDEDDSVPITHRVISNDSDAKTIVTKGDANPDLDPIPIQYNNVIGKVIWHTPALGVLTAPLTKPLGKALMLLIVLEGFLFAEVGSRMRKGVRKTRKVKR